ncbi:chymotrypsinogen 2-like [Penaeus japonicus]|uniref:chymotrypsinogen 2-like n=1 Tax=Penaeus japonicus TaxID=27405 RepID=UPI001C70E055|nr:chymotrypsinogen 2-like [Penaeus japonicus]
MALAALRHEPFRSPLPSSPRLRYPNSATRIVGGAATEVNQYPWLVGLSDLGGTDKPFCGGSILNNEWIVTAAQPAVQGSRRVAASRAAARWLRPRQRRSPSSLQVLFNMHDWNNGPTWSSETADRIIIHPNYRQNG